MQTAPDLEVATAGIMITLGYLIVQLDLARIAFRTFDLALLLRLQLLMGNRHPQLQQLAGNLLRIVFNVLHKHIIAYLIGAHLLQLLLPFPCQGHFRNGTILHQVINRQALFGGNQLLFIAFNIVALKQCFSMVAARVAGVPKPTIFHGLAHLFILDLLARSFHRL